MLRKFFRRLGLKWGASSFVRSVIDRLIAIIRERNMDELKNFLSTEKGFRPDQYVYGLSFFHYVAGREFESAEKADEWLSYALLQKNRHIEEESEVHPELRPLDCACKWGNIFGVKWLVNHGANINLNDSDGRRPYYYYACGSSVDTTKKMLYLEKHGYTLSQDDLFYGAKSKFSSYEKANEVFHHLVNEKELSVNAIDRDGYTPLHRACSNGSFFGVKWLVEHNADINRLRSFGETPFMLACQSCIDRSKKVCYLGEKGADCQASDRWYGKTALFHATSPSECEDDVKGVLRYLVIEKGININSIDKEGRTPLLHACQERPSFVAIEQLIELGADVSVRDWKKQNALHLAARNHYMIDKSIIDLLIEKGVDVTCKDQNGNKPHQVARDGETRALLRQHHDVARFSVLREMVRPDSIKLCVVGREMAGKTTLVNSLLLLGRSPPEEKDRTPGVEILNCQIPGVGKGSTWDFGAQPTFHSAHGLFFQRSNTLFCLVLPIQKGENMTSEAILRRLLKEGEFWCAFAKAALRTLPSQSKSLIRLVIVFNLIGFNEKEGIEMRFLEEVAHRIEKAFKDTFEISHVIKMDCSKSQSDCMKDFREKLKKIREDILKAADDVPELCHAIEENLSLPDDKRENPLAYFLTTDEFEKWVAEEVGIELAEDEKEVAVEYLDASGIIINLGRRICVRPLWLCHNVIGPLLAPPNFPFGMPRENSGKASKEDIESALRLFKNYLKQKDNPSPFVVTADEALEVLLHLELCYPIEGKKGVYQIAALLDDATPVDAWCKDSTMDVYRGQRYECARSVDIISPSSFVILQCRCYHMPNVSHRAWKNGIKLVKIVEDKEVECLITMDIKKGHHCIDVIVRWPSKDGCEAVAKEFLDELKSMIARVCDERSPGAILNWFYLDSSHLQRLSKDPPIYSSRKVEEKVKDKALNHKLFSTRPDGKYHSHIKDLVIIVPRTGSAPRPFPPDKDPVSEHLLRACAAVDGADWERMSFALGISRDEHYDIKRSAGPVEILRLRVLELWVKKAKSRTVGLLLRLLLRAGISRYAIKTKYNALFGRF
ncbi:death-associated protein kinase 1-like isoform X3 [Oscarella lobularis]